MAAHGGTGRWTIHQELVAEKLEIARTLGLVVDYRVGPIDPAKPEACVSVQRSANATDDGVQEYLVQLLDGLVPAHAIVVTPPSEAAATSGQASEQGSPAEDVPQEDSGLLQRATFMRFPFFPRTIHLHGVATVGAMLTCIAVVLNLGPFAKAPVVDDVSGLIAGATIPSIAVPDAAEPEGAAPAGQAYAPVPAYLAQSAADGQDFPELIRSLMEPSPFSMTEAATRPFHLSSVRDTGSDADRRGSVDAFTEPAVDRTSAERHTVVGVWAPDTGTCSARDFRDGNLPTVINAEGAWAGDTFCTFTNKKETENGWNVVAKCSTPQEHWTSNVRLTVNENRLTWSSRRGTQAYTRCASDVTMMQAAR